MSTSDDSVREIQLSGKQLVFLFMAVTVVSVVIFLCGVLVGRGVQARTGTTADATPAVLEEASDPTAAGAAAPADAPAGPTAVPDLGYQGRLEASGPAGEKLVARPESPPAASAATSPRGVPAPPADAGAAPPAESSTPGAAIEQPAAANPAFAEPRGDGFAIQVAALRGRADAEAVAARLKAKAYPAFVLAALPGQPSGFKVRVGKFKTRAEAEKVASRLEREEQFKPWITR